MSENGHSTTLAIAYKGGAIGQSYEHWREQICRGFCRLDVEPSKGKRIDCTIKLAPIASLALATAEGVSGQFARTRELLSDGCDDFVLVSATGGPLHVTQNGKSITLSQSQMCLTEMNVTGTIGFNGTERFTTTRIPRRALLGVSPKAEQKLSQPLSENAALLAMIDRYYALSAELAPSLDAVGQRMSAQHLIDLVGLLVGADGDAAEFAMQRGHSAAQLELIKADALDKLDQCDLAIGPLAKSRGLSERQAQRLFAQAGTTFTQFVMEQRLLLARRLLTAPQHRHGKISTVANAAGFGDLSYFNRAFRKRFGATPSDMRAAIDASIP